MREAAVEGFEAEAGGVAGPHEALLWALIEAAERLGMTDAEADRLERAILLRDAPAAA